MAKSKKVPDKYYPQLQHQLACSGLDAMHYFSFHKGEGVIVEVERDNEYLKEMYAKEEEFWSCITNFKAPDMTDKDHRERDRAWHKQASLVLEIKERRKTLEKEEKEAEASLRKMSEGKSSFFEGLRYTCALRRGNVDYKKIPELESIDLDIYRNPSSSMWTLTSR